jgi:dihydroflavonol-4-reductase
MILVTGATGFLGRNLVPVLLREGYRVKVLVRKPEKAAWLRALPVEVVRGEIEDSEAVARGMDGCRWVVHAAGRFRFWGRQEKFEQANVLGAHNVMAAATHQDVEKFIHISTVVVVGSPVPGEIVDETHPTNPVDPYQCSKLKGEQEALAFRQEHGLPVVVLRPGAFYGPWGRYAFNRLFFDDPLRGNLVQVKGGQLLTFPVYIEDVAQGIVLALRKGRAGEIYNICGECLTHKEANAIISEEAGITQMRVNAPEWALVAFASLLEPFGRLLNHEPYYSLNMRSYVFNNWNVSSEKARTELGFQPIPFREGVRRTLDWYRSQGLFSPSWRRPLSLVHKLPLRRSVAGAESGED